MPRLKTLLKEVKKMENAEMQRIRYRAKKFQMHLRKFSEGYRFYSADGLPVAAVEDFTCNKTMTLSEVKDFLDAVAAAKNKIALDKIPAVNIYKGNNFND